VVCLDCGKRFAYDAKQMRLGKAIEPTNGHAEVSRTAPSAGLRVKQALMAVIPAAVIFFLALFGIKRHPKR
jgi:hypothetical protein